MTGYASLDEIRDRPLHDAVHFRKPDGSPYPMEECPIDRANAEIVPLRAQREVFCRKDGTLFPVEYNVAPIVRGRQRLGAVIEVRDITADLDSQRALRDSDERFHLLARATNDTIWDWDFDAGARVVERELRQRCSATGSTSWSPGSRVVDQPHPSRRPRARLLDSIHAAHRRHRRERLVGGVSLSPRRRHLRRSSSTAASSCATGSGRARRMIGSMMDITARKHAESELRRHAEELASLAAGAAAQQPRPRPVRLRRLARPQGAAARHRQPLAVDRGGSRRRGHRRPRAST